MGQVGGVEVQNDVRFKWFLKCKADSTGIGNSLYLKLIHSKRHVGMPRVFKSLVYVM